MVNICLVFCFVGVLIVCGFILFEMLVVILLIGIVVVVVLVLVLQGFKGVWVSVVSGEFVVVLCVMCVEVIVKGQEWYFDVDICVGSYCGVNGYFVWLLDGLVVSIISVKEDQVGFGVGCICFFFDGSFIGGYVILQQGQCCWQVNVVWFIGVVSVEQL